MGVRALPLSSDIRASVHPWASREERTAFLLHPDIPEQGPKIGSPAEHDAAGFFVGGPMPARPTGILKLMELADVEGKQNSEILTALAEDSVTAAKADKRAKRQAFRAKRKMDMQALCAELRAMRGAA